MSIPKVENTHNQPQSESFNKQQEATCYGRTWNILNLRCLGNSPFSMVARIIIGLFEAAIGALIVGGLTGMIGYVPLVVHGLLIVGCAFKDMLCGSYLAQMAEERKHLEQQIEAQDRQDLTRNQAV